ncbi:MAG TPA: polysaccharide biosynthesis tyrosine autokinase [Sphingomicrobium sp.]|nr:polysaccharide biosynthesis tyrosine autokinase [Sphingomicrobium sp.]
MNRDLAIPDSDRWIVDRPDGGSRVGQAADRTYSTTQLLDFPMLVRIISQWRWLILGALGLGIAAALAVSLLTTPLYRAFVTLEVNPPSVQIMDEKPSSQTPATTPWDFVATQAGLLESKSLAERVAQDLNLANNPDFVGSEGDAQSRLKAAAGKISGGLEVEIPDEGQLIKFSYSTESPQLAASVANGLADGFINSGLQRRYEASAYARQFLEKQIAKTRADLEKSERQQVVYAQQQGIINTGRGEDAKSPSDANSLQGESLVALNKALADAIARRVAAEGAYRQAQAMGAGEVAAGTSVLRQSRAALEAEYQDKRTLMKPEHPEMISLRSRIDELDRQIAREGAQVASGRASTLAGEYRAALGAERALQARVASLKGSVLDLRGRSIQYQILQREVDTNRSLYDALLQRYKEIGVAGGVGVSPVSIVDRAQTPTAPYKPNLPLNLALGLMFGLLGGVGGAVGMEMINDVVKTREDIRSKLGLAPLGAIPKRVGKGSFVEDLKDPASIVSEAYSAVAAALRFSTETGVPKTFLLTSTRASEGKSSSALALAQNFARRGKSVLLIDGDLRKPAFKAGTEKIGLTKLLTNDDEVGGHVIRTQYENLWLLPSGPLPPNPADLLSTGRFQQILHEASEHFDVTIVDAPPTLGLADAPLLGAVTGNILFIIEAGKTRTSAAIDALNRLEASGAHILGALLTKATETGSGYGYGHYGYGYGYGRIERKRRTEILMLSQEDQRDPHQPQETENA